MLSVQLVCLLCTRYHFNVNKAVVYIKTFLLTIKLVKKHLKLVFFLSLTRQEPLILTCSFSKIKTDWGYTCLQVKANTWKEKELCNLEMKIYGYKSDVSTFRI